ncbi:peptidyl-tRNA hydrolase 2, mitochondrial-like [Diachasma alloeum]|uniref:peptidyl-tRNA hydrolase 2, mitochondrial-like n=1 Tax=Diachasma alloeum TaxID=454923 RepID=UPI0007381F96|nr:peptidyl-tRNA hydrolase 2, mitochondrial-like [Diachasma alloeum]
MSHIISRLKYLVTNGFPEESCKMVLVVRSDIAMGRGKTASQCAHAAVECVQRCSSGKMNKKILDTWFFLGQPKIVLKISSEEKLNDLAKEVKTRGLTAVVIKDAGKTQLEPGTTSVLGIGPGPNSIVDELTAHLKLL